MTSPDAAPGTPVEERDVQPHGVQPATAVVGSVVVPAHNEQAVIGRCLRALLDGPHDLEVVVVVNGSDDATARVARELDVRPGHQLRVVELAEGGKAGALDHGDRVAGAFPRLYVDADVVCSNEAAAATCRALAVGPAEAAAPRLTYDLDGCPPVVAAYTRVWLRLHNTPWIIGSGVYGVSAAGRRRFDTFPRLIADDAFVRSRFAPGERVALDATFTAFPPRRTVDLVRRKTRVFLGHHQLEQADRPLELEHNSSPLAALRGPDRVPPLDMLAYVAVTVVAKLRARWQFLRGRTGTWERDESSRTGAVS